MERIHGDIYTQSPITTYAISHPLLRRNNVGAVAQKTKRDAYVRTQERGVADPNFINQAATNPPFSPQYTLETNSKQYPYRLSDALMSLLPQKFPKMVGAHLCRHPLCAGRGAGASGVDRSSGVSYGRSVSSTSQDRNSGSESDSG